MISIDQSSKIKIMKVGFEKDQRNLIAEKAMDLGNLTAVALIIAQFLNKQFDTRAALIGIVLFITGYLIAFRLMKGGVV